ncbi:MAG: hypothetical protein VW644_14010 [Alphaproteobacteria bacterium]|jgi:hypothetical protein
MIEAFQRQLARATTPLTYLLWALIAIGLTNEVFGPFLPPALVEIGFYMLWLAAAAVWFGWRQKKRDESAAQR